ncbi:MAG: UDPGP type 1 family protein [Phycisphaerales bacterium]|nr:MAG: UDPGP type 1 family protein [Phycisphaerales bacterium]
MPSQQYERIKARLTGYGQPHLLHFWPELSDTERASLLADIERVAFEPLPKLVETHVRGHPSVHIGGRIEPVDTLPARADGKRAEQYEEARRRGTELICQGRVAVLTVAGGQGTRLGYRGPKGCFEISPVRHKPLFQLFAEAILAARRRYAARLPWYVMTSPGNDVQTQKFFEAHRFFDLPREDVIFFTQGVIPAFSHDGLILLESKHNLVLSPDGHGGTLLALRRSGALQDMKGRGTTVISYFQVDNPLAKPVDPLFLGLHDRARSEMSSKAVSKADDLERVGNFVRLDGKVQVIEYSDLPEELSHRRNDKGLRAFDAGSIAIHALDVAFVERLTADESSFALPWHRADKKVTCVDPHTGKRIEPDEPNAVKLETFIFDAIPLARNPIVCQALRREEFSPVKNATGVDSAETARRDMVLRAARWLEQAGVDVPRLPDGRPNAVIEISPLFALDAEMLAERKSEILPIRPGESTYIG